MDLIYTDAKRIDQGVLGAYSLDLSFGAKENNFEMTLGSGEPVLEFGAFAYIEGTEYGGIVDAMHTVTDGENITYKGRTWHGMLNSKIIQPDTGSDYFIVSGDANEVLALLIARLGLGSLFTASEAASGITISNYKFTRYCKAYDGIRAMMAAVNAKLRLVWQDQKIILSAEPIIDYTEDPIDGDTATLEVERHEIKVNHLICLGKGDLAEREVIHLYVDQFGKMGDTQYFTGLDEVCDTYENANSNDLRADGLKRFAELRDNDTAKASVPETDEFVYDIGDIVGATDIKSGVSVATAVTQKIVRIQNGAVSVEYQIGS